MRDNASLTRPAYIEADLRQIFEADGFADFAALWLLDPCEPVRRCRALRRPIAHWSAGARPASKEGLAARDRLRDGVEEALIALGNGLSEPRTRSFASASSRGNSRSATSSASCCGSSIA